MQNSKICILSTGGTIVSSGTSSTQLTGYTFRGTQIDSILQSIPEIKESTPIDLIEVCNIPSSSMGMTEWIKIADTIETQAIDPTVKGFVITHGTDSMEETAFFLNLVLKTNKTVVLTGAMRPSNALSADGPLNLFNAIRIANSEKALGKGVLVCMNNEIYGARDVTKTNTLSVETFKSCNFGRLGFISGTTIEFCGQSSFPHTVNSVFSLAEIKDSSVPRVDIVYSHTGEDASVIEKILELSPQGIVFAGMGHGSIPRLVEPYLVQAVKRGVVVIRASRTGSGAVLEGYERWKNIFIPAKTFSPQKARILLMLALIHYGNNRQKIKEIFEQY